MLRPTNGKMKRRHVIGIGLVVLLSAVMSVHAADTLEAQFRELPMEARRLTGPLFWMHGDGNETQSLKHGTNTVTIKPFAPTSVRLLVLGTKR